MKLLDDPHYKVERATILDIVDFEGGKLVVNDNAVAIVDMGDWYKCVFRDVAMFDLYRKDFRKNSEVCLLGAPIDAPKILNIDTSIEPCRSFAYFGSMPPPLELPKDIVIKRLASSLASTVNEAYHNPAGYSEERMAEIMRNKGVFGAIADGRLAGFIGRHEDGGMGMLEVFDGFRRRGIGGALERFLISYIMTFGRVPLCDVFVNNAASLALQAKLGLDAADTYTFWFFV